MNAAAFISCSKSSLPRATMKNAKTVVCVLIANRTVFSSVWSRVDDVQWCAETLERDMRANCDVVVLLEAALSVYHKINNRTFNSDLDTSMSAPHDFGHCSQVTVKQRNHL